MYKKLIALMLIMIVTAAAALSGCSNNAGFLNGETEEKAEMVTSYDITVAIEKIRTLNPVISKDEDAYYINKLVYEGLFELNENLELNNVLAESYSYDKSNNSVTIKIKKGIKWHDGRELTAADVQFSIESYMYASWSGSTMFSNYVNNINYIKPVKDDPYSITIFFINPDNTGMDNFIFPIIPQHQFKNAYAVKQAVKGFVPIGTGPYVIAENNELTHILLKGNTAYRGGTPKNNINFQIMPSELDAINLMDMNNISLIFSREIDRNTFYANKEEVKVSSFPSNEVEFIGFNFKNINLQNSKVRKAIAYAINEQEILELAYFKNGVLNDNIYYPNYLGMQSKESQYVFDIVKARQMLTEAGYVDRDGDGLVENINNEKIVLNILVNSESRYRTAAAEIIKNGLDKLPIQSYIIYKDWSTYNTDLAAGNFDIYIGGVQSKENYDLRSMLHTKYLNVIGYSNPTLDILLDHMQSGISNEEKKSTFLKIRDILNDDLPYYCLLYKTYGAIASPSLQGDIKPVFNNLYNGCENWSYVYEKPAVVAE